MNVTGALSNPPVSPKHLRVVRRRERSAKLLGDLGASLSFVTNWFCDPGQVS